jgi:hypothetical protein
MSFWWVYIQLGFEHITDSDGYDHMLFLLALVAPFLWVRKKALLWMVTAFTLGHSLTLALSVLDVFRMDPTLVETLIPVTIFLTAVFNLIATKTNWKRQPVLQYAITAFFGLIHGLGFSTFFREMITDNLQLVKALLAFNIGLEFGQIVILSIIIGASFLLHRVCKIKAMYLNWLFSTLAAILALGLLFE